MSCFFPIVEDMVLWLVGLIQVFKWVCLFFFVMTFVIHIGSLSCLTRTPGYWTLPSSGSRGWTGCAALYEHGCQMKGESRNWEKMREISNTWYYFTHDIICAKGTAFILTQNWGNHWKKHFTHILWECSARMAVITPLSSHSGVSAVSLQGWVLGNGA